MSGPVCFECQEELSALQRMRFKQFCSEKHKGDWLQEFNVLGVVRLREARVQMGMEVSEPRFAQDPQDSALRSSVDRRSAARVDLDAPVRVTLLSEDNSTHSGRFVNASANGMKITMGFELFAGARIQVDCGDHSIVGEVRRCHAGTAGYVIGLETIEWTDKREPVRSVSILGDLYGKSETRSVAAVSLA
jgi:hypothetical protein